MNIIDLIKEFQAELQSVQQHLDDITKSLKEDAALAAPEQKPVAWWKQHRDGSIELNEARTFLAEDALSTGRRLLVFGDAAPAALTRRTIHCGNPEAPEAFLAPARQWRSIGTAPWWDGHPDHEDGQGPYETRTIYVAPQPSQQVPVAWVVYWGHTLARKHSVHFERETANAAASEIKSFEKEVRPLYAAPAAPAAPAQQEPVATDDKDFTKIAFDAWWWRDGQYLRAGGGDYEKSFAWHAWESALKIPCECSTAQQEPTDEQILAVMRDGNNCNYNDEAEHVQFARAVLALRGSAIPEGWQPVPVEPTAEMGQAYLDAAYLHKADGAEDSMRFSWGGYRAMLAAAPKGKS